MNQPLTTKINSKGHLEVGGCDAIELVKKFGSPLYVVDRKTIEHQCGLYLKNLKKYYPNSKVMFASKALSVTAVLQVIGKSGLGAEVSSSGELITARHAGIKPENIYYHGNNKSAAEIEEGILTKVGAFVIDNPEELQQISKSAKKLNRRVNVLIRVNPGIEAHTHEFIQTGKIDSKFGVAQETLIPMVRAIVNNPSLNFKGLHAHIGSQIFDFPPFIAEAKLLLKLAKRLEDQLGVSVEEIDLGGGLGVPYLPSDDALDYESFFKHLAEAIKHESKKLKLKEPKIIFEPGRSIVGASGVTLYTIGVVKKIKGIRNYVMVDGGMSDNPRPILYQAKYDSVVANKAKAQKKFKATVAGRFCESGDVLLKDVYLAAPERGDVLAVFVTGAYNYSMASNYNRVGRPAMVLVDGGKAKVIVKRETKADLVRNDVKI
jgi:diaminopimelate decarboxylase